MVNGKSWIFSWIFRALQSPEKSVVLDIKA